MICVSALSRRFGRVVALDGVDLEIREGELLALLGPSGSGKTTLLRAIAGLDFPDSGHVAFDGEDVTRTEAAGRGVGFVFQHFALFKHMTVASNVAFGLEVRKAQNRTEIAARVEALLTLVELGGLGRRRPAQLSGGQRQRVALARALAVNPKILLLDEPFGALDATVRKSLRKELRRIHDATGVTTLFVTHDQEEALELADRVAILNHGRIEQVGSPQDVLDRPATAFVAGFIGDAVRLDGEVTGGVFHAGDIAAPADGVPEGAATAFVRPDQVELVERGGFAARVERAAPVGPLVRLEARTAGGQWIEVLVPRRQGEIPPGEVRLAVRQAQVYPAGD